MSVFLFGDDLCAAHVRSEDLGDDDGTVSLLVIFQDGGYSAADRQARAVQGVHEANFALFVTEADIGAASLEIQEVAAGGNLPISVEAGQPNFDVVGFGGAEADVAGRQADDAVREL